MSSAIEKEIDSLVGIGYYETEGGVIADAVRALLEKKPELRREIAIYLYKIEDKDRTIIIGTNDILGGYK